MTLTIANAITYSKHLYALRCEHFICDPITSSQCVYGVYLLPMTH